MASRVLFDTNVIIDVLAKREPFVANSSAVWDANVTGVIDGYVAAISLTNFFFIMQKLAGKKDAWKGVHICLETFAVCEVNGVILKYAASLPGDDFEDNVQIACAYAYKLDSIITRDKSGFKEASVSALTPSEFLEQIEKSGE